MTMSPSIRREWIEMNNADIPQSVQFGLPPYGGSGLKWFSRASSRQSVEVSLHTEGVD